jgi:hypothetical protein
MSTKLMMAVVAIALALPPIATIASTKTDGAASSQKLAQYCIPRDQEFPNASKVYCELSR